MHWLYIEYILSTNSKNIMKSLQITLAVEEDFFNILVQEYAFQDINNEAE